MNIDLIWVDDPNTGKPSVSLTNFVVSVVFLLAASTLNLLDRVKDTSVALEYFGVSSALYFGRRVTFKNGNSIDKDENSNG